MKTAWWTITNLDRGMVPSGMEERLKKGDRGEHTAWDFYGEIWYANSQYHEEVFQYHQSQGIFSASSLAKLRTKINDRFGWE